MDPDKTLTDLRALAARVMRQSDEGEVDTVTADSLAEAVVALDDWLSGGGFLPVAWKHP